MPCKTRAIMELETSMFPSSVVAGMFQAGRQNVTNYMNEIGIPEKNERLDGKNIK